MYLQGKEITPYQNNSKKEVFFMANKITKAQMFANIKAVAGVAENAEMVAFLDKEIELVNKRNSRKSSKPSKAQIENAGIKESIATVLANADNGLTVTEISKALEGDYSTQKVSALLRQMDNVVKTYEKKVARFTLA